MTNAGRDLVMKRKRYRYRCLECGESFVAIKGAKYCSNLCRQRAKNRRAKEELEIHLSNLPNPKGKT